MIRPALLIVAAASLAAGLAGCRSKPGDPAPAADAFFADISAGKMEEAYNSTAFGFQAGQQLAAFEAGAKDVGIADQKLHCEWTKKDIDESQAKFAGDIVTENGKTLAVTMTLIPERGAWRVFSMKTAPKNAGGAAPAEVRFSEVGKEASFADSGIRELPPAKELIQLAEASIVMFNEAVQKRTFADFYNNVSFSWQQQLTPAHLQSAFQPFIDAQVNFGAIRSYTPVFDQQPFVNSLGILVLKGHYPTQPHRVEFDLKFIYEFPHWKLYGINVSLRK